MDDDDILTAYHEAGHAAIGFALGGVVEAIQLGGEHEVLGVRQFGACLISWKSIGDNYSVHLQRELLTILAGPAAEIVYLGRPLDFEMMRPWKQDLDAARKLVDKMTHDMTQKQNLLNQTLQKLQDIIRTDRCWSAVAALADALLAHEFIEEAEAEEILRFWMERQY